MKYRTAYPNELRHYGVLGMHWGVRRYQNYDGTRIAAGSPPIKRPSSLKGGSQKVHVGTGEVMRKSSGANYKKSVAGGQGGKAEGNAKLAAKAPNPLFEKTVKQGKGKDNISPAEKIAKDTKKVTDESKDLLNVIEKRDPKLKKQQAAKEQKQTQKAKKMSDKELRDNINRIKMEQEYVSLTTKQTETGYEKAKDVIDVVGHIAYITIALISVYTTIKGLKHGELDSDEGEALLHSMLDSDIFDEEFIAHAMDFDEEYVEDYLEHHGVLGMKWGVRRYQNYDGTRIGTGSGVGGGKGGGSNRNLRAANASQRDADNLRKHGYTKEADAVQKVADKQRAKGEVKLQKKPERNKDISKKISSILSTVGESHIEASILGDKKSKIRSDGKDESKFTSEQKRVSKDARKDAEEFARAKAFYGEGAGNRRKAIKTTVEAKKKKDKFYAEEFEYHLSQQDMENHMKEATAERRRKDAQKKARSDARKLETGMRFIGRLI